MMPFSSSPSRRTGSPVSTTHRQATPEESGRSCPYCRFPFDPGSDVDECGACHAVHHADCWAEGAGCAVVGCSGAGTVELPPVPSRRPTPTAAPAARAPRAGGPPAAAPVGGHSYAAPVAAPAWPAPPPPGPPPVPVRPRGPLYALLGALGVLLVACVVAAVLLLSGGDDDEPAGSTLAGAATVRAEEPDLGDQDGTAAASAEPEASEQVPTTSGPATTPDADADPGVALGPTYQGSGYTIASPGSGWVRDSEDKRFADATSSFYETRWHLKGRPDVVAKLNYTPGFSGTARSGASGVRRDPGVAVEHAYEPIGDDWLYEFSEDGIRKYDRFSTACGTGWAAFGAAPAGEYAEFRARFEAFTASLSPDC